MDFDGAFAAATCGAVRAAGGAPQLVLHEDLTRDFLRARDVLAVVLGASDLGRSYWLEPDVLTAPLPFFGICNGAQLLATASGGSVDVLDEAEQGPVDMHRRSAGLLTVATPRRQTVYMYHEHYISRLPSGFRVTASTERSPIAAFEALQRLDDPAGPFRSSVPERPSALTNCN